MSLARVAVLFLRLASLGGILLSGSIITFPFLMPEEIPGFARPSFPPGCFAGCFLFTLLPLSLVPAAIAWFIQERSVRPQQEAEKVWRDGMLLREERLGIWMRYVAGVQMRHRLCRGTPDDPVPLLLQSEIPRALHEFDPGRRTRLLRFLGETGLLDIKERTDVLLETNAVDAGLESKLPRRGLVSLATGAFALLGAFLLLWTGLMVITFIHANPMRAVGMIEGRFVELVPALTFLLVPALLCGLASAGLRRLYRQAVRSLEEREGSREGTQEIALKSIEDQIEGIAKLTDAGDSEGESFARKIIHATAAVTVSELDGLGRARLVRLLYDSGWLRGERRVSIDGFDLRAAELAGARLSGACLSGADLSGSDLSGADLVGADLRRCGLCGSDLRSAQLTDANLHGADLRYSRLQKADLENADLRAVLLDKANFWGANLTGAELSGAQGSAEYLVLPAAGI